MADNILHDTIETAKRVGELEMLQNLIEAVQLDWKPKDILAWAKSQMATSDPLDVYLLDYELPVTCKHLNTHSSNGTELICSDCGEVILNNSAERAASEDKRHE
jgi:hypothetical protein